MCIVPQECLCVSFLPCYVFSTIIYKSSNAPHIISVRPQLVVCHTNTNGALLISLKRPAADEPSQECTPSLLHQHFYLPAVNCFGSDDALLDAVLATPTWVLGHCQLETSILSTIMTSHKKKSTTYVFDFNSSGISSCGCTTHDVN